MIDAPCHYSAEQACAWASGADYGYQAATAKAEAEKAELVRKCAEICDSQGKEWDSDDVVIDKNYAHVCRDAILSLLQRSE